MDGEHAVYYWRTTLSLTPEQRQWLEREHVQRIYLHLFDVVRCEGAPCGVRPEGTLHFRDTLPRNIEVVPVVFLTPNAINDSTDAHALARLLLTRMDAMTEHNGMGIPQEVQLDFDWAGRTRAPYFDLLQTMADSLHSQGRSLSVTIRLHQLSQQAPPVDRGVLMLYNTGNFRDANEQNSILSTQSVEPYLRYLEDYPLEMDLALPTFSWNLVFHHGTFACIAPGLQLQDTTLFRQEDETHWRVISYQPIPSAGIALGPQQRLYPGDIIRREESSTELNQFMYTHLTSLRPSLSQRIILYHLDGNDIPSYPINE